MGDRRANLAAALAGLRESGSIEAVSSVWVSEPVGFRDQPEFWNLVLRLRTSLEPEGLLTATKRLEVRIGRVPSFPQGPRVLDIDILLIDDLVIDRPGFRVPHPRMQERAFVLCPLLELEPDLVHPESGQRLSERLESGTFEWVKMLFPGTALLEPS